MSTKITCRNSFGRFETQYPIALQGKIDASEFHRIIQTCNNIYEPKFQKARRLLRLYAFGSVLSTIAMLGAIFIIYLWLALYNLWWVILVIVLSCSFLSLFLGYFIRGYRVNIQKNGCDKVQHFLSRENAKLSARGINFTLHQDYVYRRRWRSIVPRIEIIVSEQRTDAPSNQWNSTPSYPGYEATTTTTTPSPVAPPPPTQPYGSQYTTQYGAQYGWNDPSAPPPPPPASSAPPSISEQQQEQQPLHSYQQQESDFNPVKDPYVNPYSQY
eukprot:gb/GECH01013275.1/.p1 GENE.gb/GECH01013275.1/~~gb/GECH01013275.1/.p1  ORF type:complete len:271 (+),score=70.84 gb/GECH01013275.1/:1-813(+)